MCSVRFGGLDQRGAGPCSDRRCRFGSFRLPEPIGLLSIQALGQQRVFCSFEFMLGFFPPSSQTFADPSASPHGSMTKLELPGIPFTLRTLMSSLVARSRKWCDWARISEVVLLGWRPRGAGSFWTQRDTVTRTRPVRPLRPCSCSVWTP